MKWRLGLGPKRKKWLCSTPRQENTTNTIESQINSITAVNRLSVKSEDNKEKKKKKDMGEASRMKHICTNYFIHINLATSDSIKGPIKEGVAV